MAIHYGSHDKTSPTTENACLQDRQDTYPKRRGLTRIKKFWESRINVCFGQDSINDPWYPVGNGNLMNILDNGIHLALMMSFDELDRCPDLITYNGAKTLNVEDQYGIGEGKLANFLVLDADSPFEAVRQRANVLASIRNGDYLFKRPEPSYEIALEVIRRKQVRTRLTHTIKHENPNHVETNCCHR